jgi:3-hydroxyacyl-[acyl-carrier-protein] dehydratase
LRWIWIDRIIELVPAQRLVALKNISMAEEYLHDHFPTVQGRSALPIMPACFIIEGMAQSAGILVGHANAFREKVALAKVSKARLDFEAVAGTTLRYTATLTHLDAAGAMTTGTVDLIDPATGSTRAMGTIDLMFSHLDNSISGTVFPEHNFIFSESFKTLLRTSGIPWPGAAES